ncbi:N-acetylmuramoyl-L-alanine amidase [Flavonifractor sp. An306]|uniref:N-acetylmuramoyl-L-alanine amidase n=1 Tax=Flavonifractor sp. An306 TaxID=1965629 RepID=UPI00174D2A9D|nr:N-acetylmuramoyl-L-alanine amidase [Flavonifractor sp. An306]
MKKLGRWVLVAALLAGAIGCMVVYPRQRLAAFAPANDGRVLILDAGHGGEDGGAVSLTGAPESGINLSIVLKIDQLMGFCGQAPVVLRTSDSSLHDSDADTLREKKASDLHNRVAAVEQQENSVLLSIHQNMFTDQKYHGAQVFFAPTAGSQELAVHTQEVLRSAVDPKNSRQAKPIPDTVYLMNHISCPAILVECGFLSNPAEEALLRTDAYQTKLAAAMAGAWLQYDWKMS